MNELYLLAQRVEQYCDQMGCPCCLIGGLALPFRGQLRATEDVDYAVFAEFGRESELIDGLLQEFKPRIQNARAHALLHRVLLLEVGDLGVDIGIAGFEFERRIQERATREEVMDGVWLNVITAEDLVVMKAFANRPQDWVDIAGVLIRNEGKLDWGYIDATLAPLAELKEDPAILEKLTRLRMEYDP